MDMSFNASIHGINIKAPIDSAAPDKVELNEEQQRAMDRSKESAFHKIRARRGG